MADEELPADRSDDAAAEAGDDEDSGEHAVADLSVPMWVWTLLGFTFVTAVVIIVIIWGGAKKGEPPSEDPLMLEQSAETLPADTQPATTRAADGF